MPDDKKPESKKPSGASKDDRPKKKAQVPTAPKSTKPTVPAEKPRPATARIHGCPRCGVSLQGMKYEGVAVEFCDTCWGYWVGRLEFETILTSKDETFSRDEKKSVNRAPAHEGD